MTGKLAIWGGFEQPARRRPKAKPFWPRPDVRANSSLAHPVPKTSRACEKPEIQSDLPD
jgi:hypothetical protein